MPSKTKKTKMEDRPLKKQINYSIILLAGSYSLLLFDIIGYLPESIVPAILYMLAFAIIVFSSDQKTLAYKKLTKTNLNNGFAVVLKAPINSINLAVLNILIGIVLIFLLSNFSLLFTLYVATLLYVMSTSVQSIILNEVINISNKKEELNSANLFAYPFLNYIKISTFLLLLISLLIHFIIYYESYLLTPAIKNGLNIVSVILFVSSIYLLLQHQSYISNAFQNSENLLKEILPKHTYLFFYLAPLYFLSISIIRPSPDLFNSIIWIFSFSFCFCVFSIVTSEKLKIPKIQA